MIEAGTFALQSPLGVVAGNGLLPIEVTKAAKAKGLSVVVAAHRGETDPAIEKLCDRCAWLRVGQLGGIKRFFKSCGVERVIFAGGIRRFKLFGVLRLDWDGVKVAAKLRSFRDDSLLRGIAQYFESSGLSVVGAGLLLKDFQPDAGLLTSRDFSQLEWRNALVGWDVAKTLGQVDVGQTVVVAGELVVAVEAMEGTDATIRRAGDLIRQGAKDVVVVKVCKPTQDERLDLPTVGEETLRVMKAAGCHALILEAKRSFMLDPERVVAVANQNGIAVRFVTGREEIMANLSGGPRPAA